MNIAVKFYSFAICGSLLMALSACEVRSFYRETAAIQNQKWYYDDIKVFDVDIQDTTALYNIYLSVRHSGAYPYSNVWLKIKTHYPAGNTQLSPININVADNKGEWYGSGLGSTISLETLIQENAILPEKGTYRFEVIQDMRENPLSEISDVGLAVEKSEVKKESLKTKPPVPLIPKDSSNTSKTKSALSKDSLKQKTIQHAPFPSAGNRP
ncbi:MAG: gliding motility lipoprotein GldH [Sphingobacteriales bacterium]|nr:gliding motility lipoprotein GldH [Sphingobacteriales bacterium]